MNKDFPEFVEIGILQQRKIEAEIIKPIYEIMKREFGLDKGVVCAYCGELSAGK